MYAGRKGLTPIGKFAAINLKSNNRTLSLHVLVPYGTLDSKPNPAPSRTLHILCTTKYPPFDVAPRTHHLSHLSCFHALPSLATLMRVCTWIIGAETPFSVV